MRFRGLLIAAVGGMLACVGATAETLEFSSPFNPGNPGPLPFAIAASPYLEQDYRIYGASSGLVSERVHLQFGIGIGPPALDFANATFTLERLDGGLFTVGSGLLVVADADTINHGMFRQTSLTFTGYNGELPIFTTQVFSILTRGELPGTNYYSFDNVFDETAITSLDLTIVHAPRQWALLDRLDVFAAESLAVPGPVAGAGLGSLLALGGGWWRMRRRVA